MAMSYADCPPKKKRFSTFGLRQPDLRYSHCHISYSFNKLSFFTYLWHLVDMADEVYEGAIGIDLGKIMSTFYDSKLKLELMTIRYYIFLCCQL